MEMYFKQNFIMNNELAFYILCGSIVLMIVICLVLAIIEVKK
jgi:hypothetical protein